MPVHGVDRGHCLEIDVAKTSRLQDRLKEVEERVVIIHITEDITTNLYLDKSLGCKVSELWCCGFPHAVGLQLGGDLCKEDLCSPGGGAYEHTDVILQHMLSSLKDNKRVINTDHTNRPLLFVSQMKSLESLFVDDVNSRLMCYFHSLLFLYC